MNMKNLPLSLLVLIFILFATTASAQVAPEQARNFQIDATHTGASSEAPGTASQTAMGRQFRTTHFLSAHRRRQSFCHSQECCGSGTTLFALDSANGGLIWSFALGGSFSWSAACYENGRVFAVNGSGLLRAFDGATGT